MPQTRRVAIAIFLSVLAHVMIFTVLALKPEWRPSAFEKDEKKKPEDKPIEIIFQAAATPTPAKVLAPAPTPTPTPARSEKAVEMANAAPPPPASAPNVIQTQLEPENLKEAKKAPDKAKFVAGKNSEDTSVKGDPKGTEKASNAQKAALAKNPPPPSPAASPDGTVDAQAALDSAPAPTPTPDANAQPSPTAAVAFRDTVPLMPTASQDNAGAVAKGNAPDGKDEEAGIAAVGAYNAKVGNAVGAVWDAYRKKLGKSLPTGTVRVRFTIDKAGRVFDVKVISNTGSLKNAEYALRAVKEGKIPPIPAERLARAPNGQVTITLSLKIF